MRSFEDFPVGLTVPLGPLLVTPDEARAFAAEFGPPPRRLDGPAAGMPAADMPASGGSFVSGWHLSALMMRMMVDGFLRDSTSQGSPGVDFMNWPSAVRPGDRLAGEMTVMEARLSRSRRGLGLARLRNELRNQDGETVLECEYTVMMLTREAHP